MKKMANIIAVMAAFFLAGCDWYNSPSTLRQIEKQNRIVDQYNKRSTSKSSRASGQYHCKNTFGFGPRRSDACHEAGRQFIHMVTKQGYKINFKIIDCKCKKDRQADRLQRWQCTAGGVCK